MSTDDEIPQSSPSKRLSLPHRLAGSAFLAAAVAISLLLIVHQWLGIRLLGCGEANDCKALMTGPLGKLAGYWPIASVGAAYFLGLLMAWSFAPREGFPRIGKWLVRFGLGASLAFISVMYLDQLLCLYCLAVHAANLGFWIVMEITPTAEPSRRPAGLFVCTLAVVTISLGFAQHYFQLNYTKVEDAALQHSIEKVVRVSLSPKQPLLGQAPFIGRFPTGPQTAPIRLVVFSDYICPGCRTLDAHIARVLSRHKDVTFSVKHFPLRRLHPSAERAARAAETAGLLGGSTLFWRMHNWLIRRKGRSFTDEELAAALPALASDGAKKIDAKEFFVTMKSEQIKARVQADIREGESLGVRGTPRLFVNGVMMRGLSVPNALGRAVAAWHEHKLPPRTAAADRPRKVAHDLFKLWQKQPVVEIPRDSARWTLGEDDAPIRLAWFADCESPHSLHILRMLRNLMDTRDDLRVEFFHYPLSESETLGEIHRLLEAAGRVGGQDAFWRMHAWILEQEKDPTLKAALKAADLLGLDKDELTAESKSEAASDAVKGDILLGVRCKLSGSPSLYVNGRLVNDRRPSAKLLKRILTEASNASPE